MSCQSRCAMLWQPCASTASSEMLPIGDAAAWHWRSPRTCPRCSCAARACARRALRLHGHLECCRLAGMLPIGSIVDQDQNGSAAPLRASRYLTQLRTGWEALNWAPLLTYALNAVCTASIPPKEPQAPEARLEVLHGPPGAPYPVADALEGVHQAIPCRLHLRIAGLTCSALTSFQRGKNSFCSGTWPGVRVLPSASRAQGECNGARQRMRTKVRRGVF
jgi:hypothetical protein